MYIVPAYSEHTSSTAPTHSPMLRDEPPPSPSTPPVSVVDWLSVLSVTDGISVTSTHVSGESENTHMCITEYEIQY